MYRVICAFNDLTDNRRLYPIGAVYPREGIQSTEDRIAELLSSNNKLGKPLIEEITEDKPIRKKRGKKNENS